MSTRGQRDVEAIVDENSRARASDGAQTSRDESRQVPSFDVTLANLHQIDTRRCGRCDTLDERIITAGESATVGDHAGYELHHAHS
jgi:hypothetical protein